MNSDESTANFNRVLIDNDVVRISETTVADTVLVALKPKIYPVASALTPDPTLKNSLHALLVDRPETRHVVFDLSGVKHISEDGIAEMMSRKKQLHESGVALSLAAPSPSTEESIRIKHLTKVLNVKDTVQEAIAHGLQR
ncbi:MAG: STAS domain-containing protein [Phycisphaeraceae bacterium]|nr:STAS domain-containing protein [Phycisphaeraceae bacterium]